MSVKLEQLAGRVVTDKAFRDELMADLESGVRKAGMSLTSEEMNDLKASVEKMKRDKYLAQLDQQEIVLGWK